MYLLSNQFIIAIHMIPLENHKKSLSVHIKPNQPGGREEINISTDYDSQDRIISLHLPNDTIFYEYNSIGKLKSVQGSYSQ
jgi:hypothetical protein